MKWISLWTAILIVVIVVLAGSAMAGPNIWANGTITLAANSRTNTQAVGLYNITGQEWAKVTGFRAFNDGLATGTITLACTDLGASDTLATLTLSPDEVDEYNCNAVEFATSSTANSLLTYGHTYAMTVTTNEIVTTLTTFSLTTTTNVLIGYDGTAPVTNSIISYAVIPTETAITNLVRSYAVLPTQTVITNAMTTYSGAPTTNYTASARDLLITVVMETATNVAQDIDWCIYGE